MIGSLRRRFVLTAMLSLFALLIILIGSIIGASYFSMERNTDKTLEMLSSDIPPPAPDEAERRPFFGYQIMPNPAPFTNRIFVIADVGGGIVSIDSGFESALDEAAVIDYSQSILAAEKTAGKIGSFKYRVTRLQNGGSKITLLDVSAQAQMLADTVQVACLIGAGCMVLMFIILMLVSSKTVRPIAQNIEKQRQFVTDAGHEIKTPLAIIQANVDAMELHTGESKWSRNIRDQALRLDGLMKQLLSLAKTDEGAAPLQEELDFSLLVKKCVGVFADIDAGKTIEQAIANGVFVKGNHESLEQLVMILLDNAVKYSVDGGTIYVNLHESGRKKVLEVVNTCERLPDADPKTLFDRFYRADTARTQKNGGYGIGLSIARAIAQNHRGKITASYDSRNVIRFCVEL